jgi:lipopolysaccharide export system permease protein
MPILWRYLLNHFLKIVIFCVFAFVSILLTMRLDEIAHFAALGAPLFYILLFTLYQIPYILPIAIPISCLIASLILIQRLSSTQELTALRACGFGLKDLLSPILLASVFLAILNFWIVSELATQSHLKTNILKSELRAINPLLLLNNKHLMRLKGIYFDALGPSRVGESASDVILAIPNNHQHRLNLLIARELKALQSVFIGKEVTLITTLPFDEEEQFDHLLIENMEESVTLVQDFAQLLRKKVWTVNNDYLKTSLLLVRIKEQAQALEKAKKEKRPLDEVKHLRQQLYRSFSDIARRISIALAVFSFTLLGTAFGIHIGRSRKKRSLYLTIFLTVFYLIAFFVAKGTDQNWALASSLYLGPHLILIFSSIVMLKRVTKGIE